MQNTEGMCANMKQACVFTAGGADRSDGGGAAWGHAAPFIPLRDNLLFQDVRSGGLEVWRRRAGFMVEESRSGSAGGASPKPRDPELPRR